MVYIAHACLNSKLSKDHVDYCNNGFVDIDPSGQSRAEQCWKYCPQCEGKGFPKINRPNKKELSEKQKINLEKLRRKN